MRESVSDIAPASASPCAVCTEAVTLSDHAIERWLLRVKSGTRESAGRAILDFVADASTAESCPRWLRARVPADAEVLLNDRRPGIALLKRRGRHGLPVIVTIITNERY